MQLSLHQLLYRTYQAQSSVLQPAREAFGLGRGQPKILSFLLSGGKSSQSEIALQLSLDPASVSRMAETLCQNGFICRSDDESDRRTRLLSLTAKGREAAQAWVDACDLIESRMLEGFSDSEKAELVNLLNKLYANVRKEGMDK